MDSPDEKSIMTYVASCYQSFSKLKAENVVERRMGKVSIRNDVAKTKSFMNMISYVAWRNLDRSYRPLHLYNVLYLSSKGYE